MNQELKNQITGGNKNTPAKQSKPQTLADFISSPAMMKQIKLALPKHITPERIARISMTALRNNPKLATCDQMSFIGAMMQSAQLGLEPNTPLGQAYLIPYGKQVQFQLGYKGLIDLAYRSNQYDSIYAMEVYQDDEFDFEYGLFPQLKHKPTMQPAGEPVFYYAVYILKSGGRDFRVWSTEKIKKHAQEFSQAARGKSSPWSSNFDSMAKKTVLKDLLRYAPKSVEFARQVESDSTVKTDISDNMTDVIGIYDNTEPEIETGENPFMGE